MYRTFDFTPYFSSAESLTGKFLQLYFNGQKPSFPIDPFKMLSDFGIPFAFRDLKKLEGIYIPPENDKDIAVVGINRNRPIFRVGERLFDCCSCQGAEKGIPDI